MVSNFASILFYGQLFFILHNSLDAFLNEIGFSIKERLSKKDFFFPIVHTEANYTKPLFVGDLLEINLSIKKISESSFTVYYALSCQGVSVGDAQTVHVAVNASDHSKMNISDEFKKVLQKYLIEIMS